MMAWQLLPTRQPAGDPTQTKSKGTEMRNNDRILVVCDDEVARRTYLEALASIFGNVEFVGDGDEAIQAVEQQPFDLVLLDISTEKAILRELKQKSPSSEVVVMTSSPNLASAKQAVQLGAYDYVAKPLEPHELIDLSRAALTHKSWALHTEQRP